MKFDLVSSTLLNSINWNSHTLIWIKRSWESWPFLFAFVHLSKTLSLWEHPTSRHVHWPGHILAFMKDPGMASMGKNWYALYCVSSWVSNDKHVLFIVTCQWSKDFLILLCLQFFTKALLIDFLTLNQDSVFRKPIHGLVWLVHVLSPKRCWYN